MAQISSTLLAAVCLQLLISAGQVLTSSPKDDRAGWAGSQCTKKDSSSPQRHKRLVNFSEGDRSAWTKRLCSAGRRQSPIDITSGGLEKIKIEPLIFDQYDIPFPTSISFDDFIVSMLPSEDHQPRPIVRGGDLKGNYVFAGLHFHWGLEGQQGSEHLLEGRRFDGEMHMVHYNDKYGDLERAKLHRDGLAVLGTWLEEEEDTLISRSQSHTAGYLWMQNLAETYLRNDGEELTKTLLKSKDDSQFLWEPLALNDFLTPEINHFFRYNGSLTTNPCSESVTWTVFRSPIIVPSEFMKMLRQKETTVRAPQPLNNRTILYGGDMITYYTGASMATNPSGLWILPILLSLLKMPL